MTRLIIVAGPSRGGKSAFAAEYAERRDLPLVSTDDFRALPWDDVPMAIAEAVDKLDAEHVVVEGVRALSFVMHAKLADRVAAIFWLVAGPCDNAKAKGLETRQRTILAKLRGELPDQIYVDRESYPLALERTVKELCDAFKAERITVKAGLDAGPEWTR